MFKRYNPPQRYVAVEAQVVYVASKISSQVPMIARVSLTDYRGEVILDTFVRPTQPVADFRTAETGLQPIHLASAPSFDEVQRMVGSAIRNRIIIGYSLWKFLSVLGLCHPAIDTRDVALFMPLRRSLRCKSMVPLSALVHHFMRRNVGLGLEHPLEIARASLDLFRSCEELWEGIIHTGSWPCTLPPYSHADYFS